MSTQVTQLLGNAPVLPRATARLSPTTRWTIGALGLALLLLSFVLVTHLARDPNRFPVINVDILGTVDYVDREQLTQVVSGYMDKGFYGLDIDNVRASVERLPWVAQARVSRVWPGRIEVRVEEHEPSARWNDDQLLSKRLALFAPPQLQLDNPRYHQWREVFAELPQIRGAEGRHSVLLDAFRAYERELAAFDLTLDLLDEDERGSQTLTLSNQVTVRLGYEAQELRMQRFLDVYERMAVKIEQGATLSTARFDMRYSNGFALGGVGYGITGTEPQEGQVR
ncbi:MAG: FtsQ-type POTRA domain-containing protein [Granulosicoccus sp.]|nr:FtsQ-type POTRA domain-containing protein [Granulosicoccus sp.]